MRPMSQEQGPETLLPRALYEGVADALRDRLFAHQLSPGSAVDELALARHYGVSRTPVREAIKVLVNEGLLKMMPCRGCEVVLFASEDLGKLLDAIELLDLHALRQLARQPDKAMLGQLFVEPAADWLTFCCKARDLMGNTPLAAIARQLHQQLRLCLGPGLADIAVACSADLKGRLRQAVYIGDDRGVSLLGGMHAGMFRQAVLAAFAQQQAAGARVDFR